MTWAGGTWSSAVIPSPPDAVEGFVDPRLSFAPSVSCVGTHSCLVVGPYSDSTGNQSLKAVDLDPAP